jgi:hypothetical protein
MPQQQHTAAGCQIASHDACQNDNGADDWQQEVPRSDHIKRAARNLP